MYPVQIRNEKLGLNHLFEFDQEPTQKDLFEKLKEVDPNTGEQYLTRTALLDRWNPDQPTGDEGLVRQAYENGFFGDRDIPIEEYLPIAKQALSAMGSGFKGVFVDSKVAKGRLENFGEQTGGKKKKKLSAYDQMGPFGGPLYPEYEKDPVLEFDEKSSGSLDRVASKVAQLAFGEKKEWDNATKVMTDSLKAEGLEATPSIRGEVARRAINLGDVQNRADLAQGGSEIKGGYQLIGNLIWDGVTGFDDDMDKQLSDLKDQQEILDYMGEGAKSVAEFLGDKELEIALEKGLVQPDAENAMALSMVFDPLNVLLPAGGYVAKLGINGMMRKLLNPRILAMEQKIGDASRKVAYAEKIIGVLDKTKVVKNNLKTRNTAQRIVKENQKILDDLGPKLNQFYGKASRPSLTRRAMGNTLRMGGYSADLLGRTLQVVGRMPYEWSVDALMKIGGFTEDTAKNIIKFSAGTLGASQLLDGIDPNELQYGVGLMAVALGPKMLQAVGTSSRHLGRAMIRNTDEASIAQVLSKSPEVDPSLEKILIDRAEGASFSDTYDNVVQAFRKGSDNSFNSLQAIPGPTRQVARAVGKTGIDKFLNVAGGLGYATAVGSSIPGGVGYAVGGEEGAIANVAMGSPFVMAGAGVGQVQQFRSKGELGVKQRGTIANYDKVIKATASEKELKDYNRLNAQNKLGVAQFALRHPDAILKFTHNPEGGAGKYTSNNGRGIIEVNTASRYPMRQIIAHEVGHKIKASGLHQKVMDIMLGDAERNIPGMYSKMDPVTKEFIIETDANGIKRYALNDRFLQHRTEYLRKLNKTEGVPVEIKRRYEEDPQAIAEEIFADVNSARDTSGQTEVDIGRGDLVSKLMVNAFEAISGRPFLKDQIYMLGGNKKIKSDLFESGIDESVELNRLIRDYNQKTSYSNLKDIEGDFPIMGDDDGVLITPADMRNNPNLVRFFKNGGIFQTDAQGNIIKGIGGQPKFISKAEQDKVQANFAKTLQDELDALTDAPQGHVVEAGTDKNGNSYYKGLFLDETIIHNLKQSGRFNPYQIKMLEMMSNSGRRMNDPNIPQDQLGNQFLSFYYKATGRGGKNYKTIRGGHRSTYGYGVTITKDKNILLNMVDIDSMDKNIDMFLRSDRQELAKEFGGQNADEIKQNIQAKMRIMLENHMKGVDNVDGSGVTKEQKNWLNAVFGAVNQDHIARNPVLTGLGVKRAQNIATYRSFRLDRVGTMEQVGEGAYINDMKIASNLFPSSNDMKYKFMPSMNYDKTMDRPLGMADNITDIALPKITQKKMSKEQWISQLNKVAGAKGLADEIGLTKWFEENSKKGKKTFTIDEVEEYANANRLNLRVHRLGHRGSPSPNMKFYKPKEDLSQFAIVDDGADMEGVPTFRLVDTDSKTNGTISNFSLEDIRGVGNAQQKISQNSPEGNREIIKYLQDYHMHKRDLQKMSDPITYDQALIYMSQQPYGSPRDPIIWRETSLNQFSDYSIGKINDLDGLNIYKSPTKYDDESRYGRLVAGGQRRDYEESLIILGDGGKYQKTDGINLQDNPHWDQSNVVLHLRTTTRDMPDGVESAHIEELQSDWHQQGKREGYYQPYDKDNYTFENEENYFTTDEGQEKVEITRTALDKDGNFVTEAYMIFDDAPYSTERDRQRDLILDSAIEDSFLDGPGDDASGAIDGPFKKNWSMLGLKSHIKDAHERGLRRVTWSDGSEHNSRYGKITGIHKAHLVDGYVFKPGNGADKKDTHWLKTIVEFSNDGPVEVWVDKNTGLIEDIIPASSESVSPWVYKSLRPQKSDGGPPAKVGLNRVIGKELADEFLARDISTIRQSHKLSSYEHTYWDKSKLISKDVRGVKIEDKALPNHYDKRLVNDANKIAKKLGVSRAKRVKLNDPQPKYNYKIVLNKSADTDLSGAEFKESLMNDLGEHITSVKDPETGRTKGSGEMANGDLIVLKNVPYSRVKDIFSKHKKHFDDVSETTFQIQQIREDRGILEPEKQGAWQLDLPDDISGLDQMGVYMPEMAGNFDDPHPIKIPNEGSALPRLYAPTDKEIEVANSTSRNLGAVGANARVPKVVRALATEKDSILDFGAGKSASHAINLKREGYNVTAYEFGNNADPDLHDPRALNKKYNVVYASNVLNVQGSTPMLEQTLADIFHSTKPGGKVIVNLPTSPRKGVYEGMSPKEGAEFLKSHLKDYGDIELVDGTNSDPVFKVTKRVEENTARYMPNTSKDEVVPTMIQSLEKDGHTFMGHPMLQPGQLIMNNNVVVEFDTDFAGNFMLQGIRALEKGAGVPAMKAIVKHAKKNEMAITGHAEPYGNANPDAPVLDDERLKRFYEKLGGKVNSFGLVTFHPEFAKKRKVKLKGFDEGQFSAPMLMPWMSMKNDPEVQYFQDLQRTPNIPVKSIDAIRGERIFALEADRHDIRWDRMGGPLHPFLHMYDKTAIEVDGEMFKPVWANMKSNFMSGALTKVQAGGNGYGIVTLMDKYAHRSNRQGFRKAIDATQKMKSKMTPDEIMMLSHAIDISQTRKAKAELKRQTLTGTQKKLIRDLGVAKRYITKKNRPGYDNKFKELVEFYKEQDWWDDPVVKKISENFTNATQENTFNQRADLMSIMEGLPFVHDIKKQLIDEMDFLEGQTDMGVVAVQLSTHQLNDKNKRVFGVYLGEDPDEFKWMGPKEIEAREKLLANPDFVPHPSYDWLMLGKADSNTFLLDEMINLDELIPDYRKKHHKFKIAEGKEMSKKLAKQSEGGFNEKFFKKSIELVKQKRGQRNVLESEGPKLVTGAMRLNAQVPAVIPEIK